MECNEFRNEARRAAEKAGREKLCREELILLACEALSQTWTYDEKGYFQKQG